MPAALRASGAPRRLDGRRPAGALRLSHTPRRMGFARRPRCARPAYESRPALFAHRIRRDARVSHAGRAARVQPTKAGRRSLPIPYVATQGFRMPAALRASSLRRPAGALGPSHTSRRMGFASRPRFARPAYAGRPALFAHRIHRDARVRMSAALRASVAPRRLDGRRPAGALRLSHTPRRMGFARRPRFARPAYESRPALFAHRIRRDAWVSQAGRALRVQPTKAGRRSLPIAYVATHEFRMLAALRASGAPRRLDGRRPAGALRSSHTP